MSDREAGLSGALANEWKAAWSTAAFRVQVVIIVPLLIIALSLFSHFLEWIETRSGVVLQDPIVAATSPHEFTWPIFILIYAGLVIGLVTLSERPWRLLIALQSYVLMLCLRFTAMYLTPLDPPVGIIPLADPFVQFVGSGAVPTKDLFFSGHTAALLLLSFTAVRRRLKAFFAIAALIVGVLIVWQHVHYAVDVLMAPFVAYTSYRIVLLANSLMTPKGNR